ncbi:MAG: hypothetical protein Q7T96_19350 [Methylobacter sp.]|nr:hypothetical protein [Methylobacter sp.]
MLKTNALSHERIIAGFGVVVCCGLLMLAVPRFIASLYALYPEAAFKQTETKLPVEVYQKSIAHLTQALSWYQDPEYWQTLAFFYLALFNASPSQPLAKEQELLKQAQQSVIQGLKLSPVDPYAWFRLATVDKRLQTPTLQIINALRLSFYAGRVEPDLLMPRLSFSYYYYNEFNEEMQRLWQKQIPVTWTFQPEQLVKFVALHLETKSLVEEALANSPDDWKKFSLDLESYIQKNP